MLAISTSIQPKSLLIYKHLLANGDGQDCDRLLPDDGGQACDPLSSDWSSPEVHTQAPLKMDDRFDFQLVTEELLDGRGMDLIPESYRAYGNNGSHMLGGSIVEGDGAPQHVLEALTMASDHLPVVADYTPALIGDSTLDDVFDSSDLVAVFQTSQYEDDLADNSNWKSGDWNGDREFDSGDLVYAFVYGSYEPAAQPVPEPAGMAMTCLVAALLAIRRVRLSCPYWCPTLDEAPH